MVNSFLTVAQRLHELGFFNFVLPWFIVAAVFYGLLRKSKVLGEGIAVNGVVSLTAAFFVWGYFVVASPADLAGPMSRFFTSFSVILIGLVLAFLGASLAYPDFPSALTEYMKGSVFIWVLITIVSVMIFFTSGLSNVIGLGNMGKSSAGIMLLIFILMFIGLLIATIVGATKGG